MNKYIASVSLIGLSALLFGACSDELTDASTIDKTPKAYPLRADLTVESQEIGTRVKLNTDDHWSIMSNRQGGGWSIGNQVGVFTRNGNMATHIDYDGNPTDAVINEPMTYTSITVAGDTETSDRTGSTFLNEEVQIYTQDLPYNAVCMYYPYTTDMGTYSNYYRVGTGTYPDRMSMNNQGMELRAKVVDETTGEEMYRCVDMLQAMSVSTASLSSGVLSATFYHSFAELIFVRGEGFDNPPPGCEDIVVYLTQPYTHVRFVSSSNPIQWVPELVTWKSGYEIPQEDCYKWKAWKGDNYKKGSEGEDDPGYPASYVIVPTSSNSRSTIQKIEAYDNEGNLCPITSFTLNANDPTDTSLSGTSGIPDKLPYYRYRYPLVLMKDELGPTIHPFTIDDWDEPEDITDERTRGIHNEDEYNMWVQAYGDYLDNPSNEEYRANMKNYGDNINGVWHFYILNDLNFTTGTNGVQPYTVNRLQDVLEGNNNFFNITISGIKRNYPLITEITGNGAIKNLDFDGIYIDYTSTEANPEEDAVGCIAHKVTGTTISNNSAGGWFSNCNIIYGTVKANCNVGILTGTMENGWIENCTFSGYLMGTGTADGNPAYKNIFGIDPTAMPTIQDTNATGVIF